MGVCGSSPVAYEQRSVLTNMKARNKSIDRIIKVVSPRPSPPPLILHRRARAMHSKADYVTVSCCSSRTRRSVVERSSCFSSAVGRAGSRRFSRSAPDQPDPLRTPHEEAEPGFSLALNRRCVCCTTFRSPMQSSWVRATRRLSLCSTCVLAPRTDSAVNRLDPF